MKRLLATTLLALGSTSAAAQVPEGDLAQLLPGGTMFFASVDSFGDLIMLDPDGAVMQLLQEDAVKQAFDDAFDFFGDLEDEEFLLALDLEEEELARLFNGRVTVAIPEVLLEETEVDVGNVQGATSVALSLELGQGVVMLADFGGTPDRLEALLENLTKLRQEKEEIHLAHLVTDEVDGVRTYNIEEVTVDRDVNDSIWLALVDELLIFSDEEETLLDFADLARNGAPEDDRLSDDAPYREALDRIGPHDALVYMNLGEFLPLINQLIEHELKEQGMAVAMFLRAEDLIASMRLDAVKSLFAGAHVQDDEAGLVFGFTHSDTEYGLHRLLTYSDGGVEIPSYFSSDFHSASISLFDLAGAYDVFDKLLLKASPFGHNMLQVQIKNVKDEGFDIIEPLLENLESPFVEVFGYPEATLAGPEDYPTQAYVVRVQDPQSLTEVLADIGRELPDSEPVEFMNEQIRVVPMPVSLSPGGGESSMSYAVVENNLIISFGEVKMVENIIAHIKNPGASLLDDEDLMDALDELPSDDVVAMGFVNVADLLTNMLRGGQDVIDAQLVVAEPGEDLETLLEAKAALEELPDVSGIQYFIVSKTYKSYDAFVQRMLLRRNLDS